MKNVLIINAHQPYPFSEGRLNQSFVLEASAILQEHDCEVRYTKTAGNYNIQNELENFQWADVILLQSPVFWMGVPWSFKKYMDDVFTAGMGGELCTGDGRSDEKQTSNYGTGGTLKGKKYMLSLTFNAPEAAFNDPAEYLFQGKSVDDLFFPMHMNFRFFAMEPLPTFVCYDVMKNPQIESDLERFQEHLTHIIND